MARRPSRSTPPPPHAVADLALAPAGAGRIDWADRAMPVLRQVRERFAAEQPLAGVRIAASLHVTAETAGLVRALQAGGASVALCACNPLSTQDDTAAALVAGHGVSVFARRGADRAAYDEHIAAVLSSAPQIVLDDGVDLVGRLHTSHRHLLAGVRAGCEETATGVLRLRQMAAGGVLRLPVVAVDETPTRRLFDRYGTAQSTLDGVLRATNTLLAGKTVVVAGYGTCGQGIATHAAGLGASVVVTEVDPTRALEATLEGFRVLPMEQAARVADLVITATGNRDVVRPEHLALLRDGAILANAGHFDVEIDVAGLAELAAAPPARVRPHTDEYVLADGRRVYLLAEGRLVNLGAAEGHPAAVMDASFAVQALTVAWLAEAAGGLAAGVHPVPPEIDRDVAALDLLARGVGIDALTPTQEKYLTSWDVPG